MRRPRVLSTSPAVTQEKALEIANNFEPDFAAKTRAQMLTHRSRSSFQNSYGPTRSNVRDGSRERDADAVMMVTGWAASWASMTARPIRAQVGGTAGALRSVRAHCRGADRAARWCRCGRAPAEQVARKSKKMSPKSKEPRVGMAYITATCRGSNRRLAHPGRGAGREGRDGRVPFLPPTRPRGRVV